MVDNLDLKSIPSSDISESLRDQILGRSPRRKQPRVNAQRSPSQNLLQSYEVISQSEIPNTNQKRNSKSSRDHSFQIISKEDILPEKSEKTSSKQNRSDSFEIISVNLSEGSRDRSFQVISHEDIKQKTDSRQSKNKSFQVISPKNLSKSSQRKNSEDNETFYTANGGSRQVFNLVDKKESVLEMVPIDNSKTTLSANKDLKKPQYASVETQTVPIQTQNTAAESDYDCGCCQGKMRCTCGYDYEAQYQKPNNTPEDTTDFSNFENYTETSSQTADMERYHHNRCYCNCRQWDYDSSMYGDEFSDSSEFGTDFLDLPYQNNEDYLKMLRELENKLIARNRERVRKTMMEFERRSRKNQNLEKPIWDYDDDSASLLQKLSPRKHKKKSCCKCGKHKKVNSDIMQNEKHWEQLQQHQPPPPHEMVRTKPHNQVERSLHKSHWKLDPRSGEWVKISCFQQTDFAKSLHGDYLDEERRMMPPPAAMCKKDCCCRHKRRR